MEHTQALETHASDRYLLGQLSAAEADAFEEHYFECPVCAEDVRLGMSFLEGGRRLVHEPAAPITAPPATAPALPIASHPRWGKWIPAAAAAAVLALAGNFVVLMRMQNAAPVPRMVAMSDHAFFEGLARDAADPIQPLILPKGSVAELSIELTPPRPFRRYEARVLRANNKVVATCPIAPQLLENTVRISLPDPGPGTYSLVIVGIEPAGETVLARHPFEVKRKTGVQSRRERWNSHTTQVRSAPAA